MTTHLIVSVLIQVLVSITLSEQLLILFSNNVKLPFNSSADKVFEYASIESNQNENKCTVSTDCKFDFKVCFSGYCIIKRCMLSINCPDDSYCNESYRMCFPKEVIEMNSSPITNSITRTTSTKVPTTTATTTSTNATTKVMTLANQIHTEFEIAWPNLTQTSDGLKKIFQDTPKYQQNIQVNNNHHDSSALLW
jgi:hypothetical protein